MARHHNEACPSPSKEYESCEKQGETSSNFVTCRCVVTKPTQVGSNKKAAWYATHVDLCTTLQQHNENRFNRGKIIFGKIV